MEAVYVIRYKKNNVIVAVIEAVGNPTDAEVCNNYAFYQGLGENNGDQFTACYSPVIEWESILRSMRPCHENESFVYCNHSSVVNNICESCGCAVGVKLP